MEGTALSRQRSVLIVDPAAETREVLQTVLERRGVTTMSATRLRAGLALAQQNRPDLIVLDIESLDAPETHDLTPFGELSLASRPKLLMLATFRRQGEPIPDGEFMRKPYEYAALIRKIEELIGESGSCQHCSSSAEPIKEPALN
jgi:DNA-binding NtrC family response regulator